MPSGSHRSCLEPTCNPEEFGRGDADDGHRNIFYINCFTYNAGIRVEAVVPIRPAQHRHGIAGAHVIVSGSDQTAESGLDTQRRERIPGDVVAIHAIVFRKAVAADQDARVIGAIHNQVGEGLRVITEELISGPRKRVPTVLAGIPVEHLHQAGVHAPEAGAALPSGSC